MKKIYILIFAFAVSGCDISTMHKAKQDYACRDDGGVYEYATVFQGVRCRSGKFIVNWSTLVVTEEFMPKSLLD